MRQRQRHQLQVTLQQRIAHTPVNRGLQQIQAVRRVCSSQPLQQGRLPGGRRQATTTITAPRRRPRCSRRLFARRAAEVNGVRRRPPPPCLVLPP